MSIDREPDREPSADEAGEPVTADTDKTISQADAASADAEVQAEVPPAQSSPAESAQDSDPTARRPEAEESAVDRPQADEAQSERAEQAEKSADATTPGQAKLEEQRQAESGEDDQQLDFQRADLAEQDSSDVTDEGLAETSDLDREENEAEQEPEDEDAEPLELVQEPSADEELSTEWYILKVQVNREDSIRDALQRRVKIEGLDRFFKEIVVPTEDVAEFTKTGKRRIIKRKLYPGYIMVNMHINDDTWFLVRETPGIGDFTGSAGKPTPMNPRDVERILNLGKPADEGDAHVKTAIPFKQGDRVRVKDGYFQNFEGDVESVDEANGRVTVMINIFGRSTPVELEHWQIEAV